MVGQHFTFGRLDYIFSRIKTLGHPVNERYITANVKIKSTIYP